jgi:hypothetical protein
MGNENYFWSFEFRVHDPEFDNLRFALELLHKGQRSYRPRVYRVPEKIPAAPTPEVVQAAPQAPIMPCAFEPTRDPLTCL